MGFPRQCLFCDPQFQILPKIHLDAHLPLWHSFKRGKELPMFSLALVTPDCLFSMYFVGLVWLTGLVPFYTHFCPPLVHFFQFLYLTFLYAFFRVRRLIPPATSVGSCAGISIGWWIFGGGGLWWNHMSNTWEFISTLSSYLPLTLFFTSYVEPFLCLIHPCCISMACFSRMFFPTTYGGPG